MDEDNKEEETSKEETEEDNKKEETSEEEEEKGLTTAKKRAEIEKLKIILKIKFLSLEKVKKREERKKAKKNLS